MCVLSRGNPTPKLWQPRHRYNISAIRVTLMRIWFEIFSLKATSGWKLYAYYVIRGNSHSTIVKLKYFPWKSNESNIWIETVHILCVIKGNPLYLISSYGLCVTHCDINNKYLVVAMVAYGSCLILLSLLVRNDKKTISRHKGCRHCGSSSILKVRFFGTPCTYLALYP